MTVPSVNKTIFAVKNIVYSLYDDTTRYFHGVPHRTPRIPGVS
jgi:hypothetical protein